MAIEILSWEYGLLKSKAENNLDLVIKLESGLGSKGLNDAYYAGLNSKPDDLSLINNHYNSLAIKLHGRVHSNIRYITIKLPPSIFMQIFNGLLLWLNTTCIHVIYS